jgi:MFS family permease
MLSATMVTAGSVAQLMHAALPVHMANQGLDPPTIGLVLGAGSLSQVVGALAIGALIDRYGARRLLTLGGILQTVASLGFLVIPAIGALAPWRVVQTLGIASTSPASLTIVPHIVPPNRQATTMASLTIVNNAAATITPPLGLALLAGGGPLALFGTAAAFGVLSLIASFQAPDAPSSGKGLRFTFRTSWLSVLLMTLGLFLQRGVILAFFALTAFERGLNPGLYFSIEAAGLILGRIPGGRFADRVGVRWPIAFGAICIVVADLLLADARTTEVMAISALLNGAGGGLMIPGLTLQLIQRSDNTSRGTALSYFTSASALGPMLGSAGGGLLFTTLGFSGNMVLAGALCLLTLVIAFWDFRPPPSVESSA